MQDAATPTITLGENVQVSGGDTRSILAPIRPAAAAGVISKSAHRVV
jgi:hypothetical protein